MQLTTTLHSAQRLPATKDHHSFSPAAKPSQASYLRPASFEKASPQLRHRHPPLRAKLCADHTLRPRRQDEQTLPSLRHGEWREDGERGAAGKGAGEGTTGV